MRPIDRIAEILLKALEKAPAEKEAAPVAARPPPKQGVTRVRKVPKAPPR